MYLADHMHTYILETHLANTHAGFVKAHVLPVLAVHAYGLLGGLPLLLQKLQLCHAVKQLCQVARNLRERGNHHW